MDELIGKIFKCVPGLKDWLEGSMTKAFETFIHAALHF